jgi:hypothetical protein
VSLGNGIQAEAGRLFFPMDLDIRNRRFLFRRTSIEALKSNPFLDNRFADADDAVRTVEVDALQKLDLTPSAWRGYLFHTSFCCSTLLARLLDFPGRSLALKEPLILRRLSDAALNGTHSQELTAAAVKLLFRDVDGGSAILVKPTHVALNIAAELLACKPSAKALLITSTLENFLISNIKKSEDTQRKVPELVERFMAASDLSSRLPPEAFEPPSFLAGVSLQWHAQQQLVRDLLNGPFGPYVQVVQEAGLLQAPADTLRAALDWLGWAIPEDAIEAQITRVMNRHAKSTGRTYNLLEKTHETDLLRRQFSDELAQALRWSERFLSPYLKPSI